MNSLAPDPNWVLNAEPTSKSWIWGGGSPRGDTYILTIESTYEYLENSKWIRETNKGEGHVTILNDRAYFYYFCN